MLVTGIMGNFSVSKPRTYKSGYLLPVMTAEALLKAGRHQAVLRQLKDCCGLSEEYYEAFYVSAVESFVEFVQVLPVEFTGPLCGMMNEGIARATVALHDYQLRHKEHLDPLKSYAVFTAGLFRDISRVLMNQQVVLTNEEGNLVEHWNPFDGPMVGRAEFYRLLPLAPFYQRLDITLRHLLARQLMPKEGYQWIASDFHVLADWFDAISGEEGGGGTLVHILSNINNEEISALHNSLVQVPVEQTESPATEHGQAFYEWLTDGLEKQEINVNTADAGVHMVEEGVFLERPRIFREFLEVYNQPVTLAVVYAQFGNYMGIAKKGGSDFMNSQYFSEYPDVRDTSAAAFASPLAGKQQSVRVGMVLASPMLYIFLKDQGRVPANTALMRAMQTKGQGPASAPLPKLNTSSPTSSPITTPTPRPKHK